MLKNDQDLVGDWEPGQEEVLGLMSEAAKAWRLVEFLEERNGNSKTTNRGTDSSRSVRMKGRSHRGGGKGSEEVSCFRCGELGGTKRMEMINLSRNTPKDEKFDGWRMKSIEGAHYVEPIYASKSFICWRFGWGYGYVHIIHKRACAKSCSIKEVQSTVKRTFSCMR